MRARPPITRPAGMSRSPPTCRAVSDSHGSTRSPPAAGQSRFGDHQARPRRQGATPGRPGLGTGWATNAKPGAVLDVSQPCGDLVLDELRRPAGARLGGHPGSPHDPGVVEDLSCRQPDRVGSFLLPTPHIATHASHAPSASPGAPPQGDAEGRTGTGGDARVPRPLHPARPGRLDLSDIQIPSTRRYSCAVRCRSCRRPEGPALDKGISAERIHYRSLRPRPVGLTPTTWESTGEGRVSTLARSRPKRK